ESGDHADALQWWHRLSELDPLSARYTAAHMQSLAKAGDRSSALARAKVYREAVQRELDTEPDPTVLKLEQSLRTSPPPVSRTPVTSPAVPPLSKEPPTPSRSGRRVGPWLVAAAVLGIAGVFLLTRRSEQTSTSSIPFLAVGAIRVDSPSD